MILHLDELPRLHTDGSRSGSRLLWVPSEEVAFHRLPRPQAPRHKWDELVPWMLEDRLLADPADTHCVHALDDSGQWLDVACVSRATLNTWRLLAGASEKAGLRLIPDVLALPLQADRWSLHIDGERCLVRTGSNSGFVCNIAWLRSLLEESSPVASRLASARISCSGQRGLEIVPGLSAWPDELDWSRAPDAAVRIDLSGSNAVIASQAWSWLDRLGLLSAGAALGAALLFAAVVSLETQRYESESKALQQRLPQHAGAARSDWPANPASGLQALLATLARSLSVCSDCRIEAFEADHRTLSLRSPDADRLLPVLREKLRNGLVQEAPGGVRLTLEAAQGDSL